MVVKSLKLFLLGLLVWPVLINVIGFMSGLLSGFMISDEGEVFDLLHMVQPYFALFSIIFSMSLVILVRVDERNWMKILSWITATVYAGCSVYGFFPEEDIIHILTSIISSSMEIIMLFLGGLILLNVFQKISIPSSES